MKYATMLAGAALASPALAQSTIDPANKQSWSENCGWMNWYDAGSPPASQGVAVHSDHLTGYVWFENTGWMNLGHGGPYTNTDGTNFGVNVDAGGLLSGYAWGENIGWINFSGGAMATPAAPARIDLGAHRLRGYAWGENIGWINLDNATHFVGLGAGCGSPDFDCDGDIGTDSDIEAFFACLAGGCPPAPCASTADFDADGDIGTDADIEAFFRVLAGGQC